VPDQLMTKEICLAAVQLAGYALQYVPDQLKTKEICLTAVQKDGYALEYVPDQLMTVEICLAAVGQSAYALQYVPSILKTPAFYTRLKLINKDNLNFYYKNIDDHAQVIMIKSSSLVSSMSIHESLTPYEIDDEEEEEAEFIKNHLIQGKTYTIQMLNQQIRLDLNAKFGFFPTKNVHFKSIPDSLSQIITSYLEQKDMMNLKFVNKLFHEVISILDLTNIAKDYKATL
jgi:hypothetical protein